VTQRWRLERSESIIRGSMRRTGGWNFRIPNSEFRIPN
jgi:hypothetical protein